MTSAALARVCAAWNSPSVAMILARFSRSASACLASARTIVGASSASLTSTALTLMPHGSVCLSMIACSVWLILSRLLSSSSRLDCPSTARSVVWAICEVAVAKLKTRVMAARASSTWKKMTALTLTVTLSEVMTSCGGTSRVITRRSTLVRRSTPKGRMRKRPGPLSSISRPSRNTTPRSYSLAIRTVEAATTRTSSATTATMTIGVVIELSPFGPGRAGIIESSSPPLDDRALVWTLAGLHYVTNCVKNELDCRS